ncbi:MAG TPA: hypothetical protein RMH99_06855 [Sandaracinaceae bacterium LLY-WYZ-13_1]|nr:hypothetical protein [Sandaracinaceae bacterium LLY-WYZ-13_1]
MMQMASNERARLFVDGVGATITADVVNRRDDGMVVSQALPFLRLDTGVSGDDGRRARISRVTIAMEGDVPRLLVELSHDEVDDGLDAVPAALFASPEEDTVETFTPGVSTRPARTDATVPYELQLQERPSTERVVGRTERTEPPPRLPAPEVPLWVRAWRRLGGWLSMLLGRPRLAAGS